MAFGRNSYLGYKQHAERRRDAEEKEGRNEGKGHGCRGDIQNGQRDGHHTTDNGVVDGQTHVIAVVQTRNLNIPV